jgi:hypothetical protein
MFTPSDLSDLITADPPVAVSAFQPTHVRGGRSAKAPSGSRT